MFMNRDIAKLLKRRESRMAEDAKSLTKRHDGHAGCNYHEGDHGQGLECLGQVLKRR